MADVNDDMKYSAAMNRSIFRRPITSLTAPAQHMANNAPRVGELTTKPCCHALRPNSVSMKPMAPEITLASKPKMNPPMATTSVCRSVGETQLNGLKRPKRVPLYEFRFEYMNNGLRRFNVVNMFQDPSCRHFSHGMYRVVNGGELRVQIT